MWEQAPKWASRHWSNKVVVVRELALLGGLLAVLAGCGPTEDTPPPDVTPDVTPDVSVPEGVPELPDALAAMDTAEPTRRIYVSASHACEDESLNDGSVETCDGNAGPFASIVAMGSAAPEISPGTAVVFREGTYAVTNLGLSQTGTADAPIQLLAYPGESPVLDGGFYGDAATYVDRVAVVASGKYLVIKGLEFVGCHRTCVLVTGQHVVVADNTFVGGVEDSLKTSVPNSDVYIARNHFSLPLGVGLNPDGSPEAIDGFQSRRVWVTQNEFTDSDTNRGGWGTVVWFKAGSEAVYFYDNHVHDIHVNDAATIMGGCCFNNWTWEPSTPVAANVVFSGNTIERITFESNYKYRGSIVSYGCHGCAARNNVITDCEVGLSVRNTDADGQPVPEAVLVSTDVTFEGNQVGVTGTGYLFAVEQESGLVVDNNTYQCSSAAFRYEDEDQTQAEWQALGFDTNSQLCP